MMHARADSSISRFAGVVFFAVLLVVPRSALAIGLLPNTQMGVSRSRVPDGGYEYWSVWAGRSDGHLVALRDAPAGQPSPVWQDYSAPYQTFGGAVVPVGPHGVSATSWYVGAVAHEEVCYVGGGPQVLICLSIEDRLVVESNSIDPPDGQIAAGPIAMTRRTWPNGDNEALVFATMIDGSMWVLASQEWQQLAGPLQLRVGSPLAASSSPDGQWARVFGVSNQNPSTVKAYRWSSGTGFNLGGTDISKPGTTAACGTMAAAEGLVGTTEYRVYLFCTNRTTADPNVYYRYSQSTNGTSFQPWTTTTLLPQPASGNVVNSGYAMAAQSRAENGRRSIDLYVLSTANRVWHAEHTAWAAGLSALADLGDDGETTARTGALAATPAQPVAGVGGYSNVYYVGPILGANHLYRRKGDESLPAATRSNWAAHQSGDPRGFVSADPGGTESSTALFRGDAVNVVMRHPPPAPDPMPGGYQMAAAQSEVRWSYNDGETWGAPTTLVPAVGYDQTGDCTVDFDESRDAYLTFLSSQRQNDDCDQPTIRNGVFYYRWVAGSAAPEPGPVAVDVQCAQAGCVPANPGRIDHPWVAVYRDLAGDDRRHFVWYDRVASNPDPVPTDDQIRYLNFTHQDYNPALGDTIRTLHLLNGQNFLGGTPQVFVGRTGKAWVATYSGLCLLNNFYTDCLAADYFDVARRADSIAGGYQVPNSNGTYVRIGNFRSFVPSPSNDNRIYYVFQKLEAGSTQLTDLFFCHCDFNGANIGCSAPLAVAGASVAGSSQFGPELTTSQDSMGNDLVFLNWYDTRFISTFGDCSIANRCYVPMRAVSFDGLTFQYAQRINVDSAGSLSDFVELPSECSGANDPKQRFMGDYHAVVGAPLHSLHVVVGAPDGSAPGTGTLTRHWISGGSWYAGW